MQYLLLIYGDETQGPRDPAAGAEMLAKYRTVTEGIRARGAFLAADALKNTSSATTVRVRAGRTTMTDGPFAETKEQLGGYYLVDVPDLDAAIAIAAQIPGAETGSVEIRPIMTY